MDYPKVANEISIGVGIDHDNKLKKHILEAEKRLKKVEQDYLHTIQKYEETSSHWQRLCDDKRRATNRCFSAAAFINSCNEMAEKLQKALDKLPTTEETIDHSLQITVFDSGKSLAQESMIISHEKAQCQKLDSEAIDYLGEINGTLDYIKRKMLRIDTRKAVHALLKEVKEKNKCIDKALSNCTLVCNPTKFRSLRKFVELEIKVLKKLIRELQKDMEGKLQIKQYATKICKDFKQKAKHLEEKKEHLSGQWDEETKYTLGVKIKRDGIGTYPQAQYIKLLSDQLP